MSRPMQHFIRAVDGVSVVVPRKHIQHNLQRPPKIMEAPRHRHPNMASPSIQRMAHLRRAKSSRVARFRARFLKPKMIITDASILLLLSVSELTPFLLHRPHLIAGMYTLLAMVLRVKSQKTLGLALIFLIAVPLLYVTGLQPMAEVYATLSYFFLVIGALTAVIEMKFST